MKICFGCFSAHFTNSWFKCKIWSVSLIALLLFVAENNIITSFVGQNKAAQVMSKHAAVLREL